MAPTFWRVSRYMRAARFENHQVSSTITGSTAKDSSASRTFIESMMTMMPTITNESPTSVTTPLASSSLITETSLTR